MSPAPEEGGTPARMTVNLVPRASQALARVMELTGNGKTDCTNRALPIYAYIEEVLANGGSITVEEYPGDEPRKLVIF